MARAVLHVHGERAGLRVGWGARSSPERCPYRDLSAGGNGPRVQVSPERTQVHEGRTVRLYCRAAGVPSATITWRKEGGSLPPQVRMPDQAGPMGSAESQHLPPARPLLLPFTSKMGAYSDALFPASWQVAAVSLLL